MKLFVASVESGSLSGAARQTGLSLSSVSRHLTGLEERLGVRLLIRSTRMLAPTDAGQMYYAAAKRLLAEVDEVERSLTAGAAAPVGRLRVTGPTLFGRVHLLPLMARFLVAHPQVTLDISLLDRPVNLFEEGIDLAIVVGDLEDSSLISRRLGAIRWVLSASPDYLQRRGHPTGLTDLASHDCLMYSQQSNADEWRLMDGSNPVRVKVPVRMRSNTLDGVVTAAVQGGGIVLAPAWAVADHVSDGKLQVILRQNETPSRPINAVLTHNRLLASKVRTLLDFLVQEFSQQDFDGMA
ncbi:LysR family transcriptional regulator [Roseomonas chloroacetimidivorans]|uniref:LysR family transcriptional regulator n=1 Tax=Roseomonas chloroacetimidivorans TaxID=1766656 RepID=UPI003C77C1FD